MWLKFEQIVSVKTISSKRCELFEIFESFQKKNLTVKKFACEF